MFLDAEKFYSLFFLSALAKHDLGWQDIVPNINFFCSVPVYEDGHTEDSVFVNGKSVAGDYVDFFCSVPGRAELCWS